jgi:hypothetical protein
MTESIQKAAHNTALILGHAESPRIHGAGVLDNPRDYLAGLQAARELLIGRAIADHEATTWPAPSDYHAQ